MRRGARLPSPPHPKECRPDLPPICQQCGHQCPELRALLNHWTDKHWSGLDSLPRLRQQLAQIEARTVNPAEPEGLEVELTLCLQARLPYLKKRVAEVRQKLLHEVGLDCAIHLSCIGWTNHPQGSYRIFLRGQLLYEDVVWLSEPGQEDIWQQSLERVCREQQAALRPHRSLHPPAGLVLEASTDLFDMVRQPHFWLPLASSARSAVVVTCNPRLPHLTLCWQRDGQTLAVVQVPESGQILSGPTAVLGQLGRLISVPGMTRVVGEVPPESRRTACALGCSYLHTIDIVRLVVNQGLMNAQSQGGLIHELPHH